MDKIENVKTSTLKSSKYLQMYRMHYDQDGRAKAWDVMKAHDSVAVLIHNISRDVFVFVKQFRPAVYLAKACKEQQKPLSADSLPELDTSVTPGKSGLTYELCAGIVDKDISWDEIAREEVLEETGYDVPLESLEKIITGRGSVGASGTLMNQYYVQVTDEMRKTKGGGCAHEGEFIEVVEVPVKDSLKFAFDESIEKPVIMVFAILWYHQFKGNSSK